MGMGGRGGGNFKVHTSSIRSNEKQNHNSFCTHTHTHSLSLSLSLSLSHTHTHTHMHTFFLKCCTIIYLSKISLVSLTSLSNSSSSALFTSCKNTMRKLNHPSVCLSTCPCPFVLRDFIHIYITVTTANWKLWEIHTQNSQFKCSKVSDIITTPLCACSKDTKRI